MSNTKSIHTRFWRSMGERFGSRWLTDFGKEPSKAWVDLLDQYTPAVIGKAIDMLALRHENSRSHPPTHAEFEALLKRAAVLKGADETDYLRAYWRSVAVSTAERTCWLLNMLPWGEHDLSKLPDDQHRLILVLIRDQMQWAIDSETKQGQRTPGIEQTVNAELWRALKPYRREPPPIPEKAETNTQPNEAAA